MHKDKHINKIFVTAMILLLFLSNTNVFATADWWDKAGSFFSGASATPLTSLTELQDIIRAVGNMIFFVVTVILGIKYIYGSVESKASVKDSLLTLVVAAIAFYSWSTIRDLFIQSDKLVFLTGDAEASAKNIYSVIIYVCNFAAIGGIVFIGVKYMMAGAEGRASLKAKSPMLILGIIMVYATFQFLTLIVSVV